MPSIVTSPNADFPVDGGPYAFRTGARIIFVFEPGAVGYIGETIGSEEPPDGEGDAAAVGVALFVAAVSVDDVVEVELTFDSTRGRGTCSSIGGDGVTVGIESVCFLFCSSYVTSLDAIRSFE